MTSALWAATARYLINCPGPGIHGARCLLKMRYAGSQPQASR